MYFILRFLPKKHLSYLFGCLARISLPRFLAEPLICWYSKRYGVRLEEAEHSPGEYSSLADFFVRDLKSGLRPIGEGIVSPVDGRIVQTGLVTDGELLQVKEKTFSAAQLFSSEVVSEYFEGGVYVTIYLAPGDYHHIHSPIDGTIVDSYHIPGALWPVNTWSTNAIKSLFAANERIITIIESEAGKLAVVKVGATNVGSIRTEYNSFIGNRSFFSACSEKVSHQHFSDGIPIEKGQRLASFHMGSTVLLLFPPGMKLSKLALDKVVYGQSLWGVGS